MVVNWKGEEGMDKATFSIIYIVGLTPKIVFRNGTFMFTKEEVERLAQELKEGNPSLEFHVSNLQPNKA